MGCKNELQADEQLVCYSSTCIAAVLIARILNFIHVQFFILLTQDKFARIAWPARRLAKSETVHLPALIEAASSRRHAAGWRGLNILGTVFLRPTDTRRTLNDIVYSSAHACSTKPTSVPTFHFEKLATMSIVFNFSHLIREQGFNELSWYNIAFCGYNSVSACRVLRACAEDSCQQNVLPFIVVGWSLSL